MKTLKEVLSKIKILTSDADKRQIVKLFVVMLISACLEVFGVSMIVPFMKMLIQPDAPEVTGFFAEAVRIFKFNDSKTFILCCSALLILIYIVKNLVLIGEAKMTGKFVTGMKANLRNRLFREYLLRPYAYFLDKNSSELHHNLIIDVDKSCEIINQLLKITTDCVISFFLCITIFIINPVITIGVTVVLLIVVLFIVKVIRPKMNATGREVVFYGKLRNKWIMQGLTGIKEVKHLGAEDFVADLETKAENEVRNGECKRYVASTIPKALIEASIITCVLILVVIMILNGADAATLIPPVSALAMAAIKLLPGASRITSGITVITYNKPSLDLIVDALKKNDGVSSENAVCRKPDDNSDTVISLENVVFKYKGGNRTILDDVSLKIKRGSMVGIMGESGSGKTTLADIIMGLLKEDKGIVKTNPGNIGYVTQFIFMLDDTIRNNVAFGVDKDNVSDERIWECLEEAQLADFVRELPEGLDTQIGERGIRISGGQLQRIGIARALYNDPEILLFDEATSALDAKSEAAIIKAINGLHGRKTIIVIAHKSVALAGCDLIYRLENGKVVTSQSV